MLWEKKRKYERPTTNPIAIGPSRVLCGSVKVETINKEFVVKTDDYELESDTWSSNTITFD